MFPIPLHENYKKFLHIPFANKGIDAINISNIFNRKEVVKEIPPYFKNIPRGFCILESKSLKVSCNVLGLEAFLTFGC
jgi:hypothetical protein